MISDNITPSRPRSHRRLCKLSATANGALLSFSEDANSSALFGLRGAFGDRREELAAFIALKERA